MLSSSLLIGASIVLTLRWSESSVNDVLLTIDSRQEAVLVLLDMSSVFDTIDHSLLLQRLRDRYGVGGTALPWFESYLTDRAQSVTVGNVTSAPQRSILWCSTRFGTRPSAVCTLLCSKEKKITLSTMETELSSSVHQDSGTIFHFTFDRPNPYEVLSLSLKLTYLIIIVSLIISKF